MTMSASDNILVLYGSYRSDRKGIRLANYIVAALRARGCSAELIDAQAIGLPMLDRMYNEYPKGSAPPAMERLAGQISAADAFVFVVGEYNWGLQPGLKNLTDHFLAEWYWRPAAIASYSAGRIASTRAATAWHGTLSGDGHGGDFEHHHGRVHRPLFFERGHAYVYLAYGSSFMLNVSSEASGVGAGVLIRAIEPTDGITIMERNRGTERLRGLARGPGRLSAALAIDCRLDGSDLCQAGPLWLGSDGRASGEIGQSKRIGITRAVDSLRRFYVRGNRFVSGPQALNR